MNGLFGNAYNKRWGCRGTWIGITANDSSSLLCNRASHYRDSAVSEYSVAEIADMSEFIFILTPQSLTVLSCCYFTS